MRSNKEEVRIQKWEMQNDKRDLQERTKQFALSVVIRRFSIIPKMVEAQIQAKQMLRSGTSVGANYREALCHNFETL